MFCPAQAYLWTGRPTQPAVVTSTARPPRGADRDLAMPGAACAWSWRCGRATMEMSFLGQPGWLHAPAARLAEGMLCSHQQPQTVYQLGMVVAGSNVAGRAGAVQCSRWPRSVLIGSVNVGASGVSNLAPAEMGSAVFGAVGLTGGWLRGGWICELALERAAAARSPPPRSGT